MADSTQETTANWTSWSRSHRQSLAALAHVLLFALSWILAFGLAYNFRQIEVWGPKICLPMLPLVVIVKLVIFWLMRLHRGSWRYVGVRDVMQVVYATWISFVWIWATYYVLVNLNQIAYHLGFEDFRWEPFSGLDFPDSVLLLDFMGTIALVVGARVAVRLYYEEVDPKPSGALPRLLILGAGNSGEQVVRETLRQPVLQYHIEGFLDDDASKLGQQIHGVEVLGTIDDIKQVCEEHEVDEILIAMPSATRKQVRRVVELCQGTNLKFKTLPALADLIAGRAQVQEIRDVDIKDLLGRAPVRLDEDHIRDYIKGRIVLVTGAGGSIGSEMCRQIARFSPARLVLVEQAEQNLFNIDRELRQSHPELAVAPCIADIGDAARVDQVFAEHQPTAVFHAAAHKHVPMMELNPGEAIKNNVHGTRMVADAADHHGCEKFVMISTDKAVNPTSVMGCSKRIAEKYIQALNERSETQYVTVRFGNVLGSSGSVVPIFKEQIARGGPVTVTHAEMVRYFMTIPEASQLVLQAASMGSGGEIFVLDMGEPVKIIDLARDLITLSGLRPGEDIEIRVVGMRPGEKLFEELSLEAEGVSKTEHPKIGIYVRSTQEWTQLVRAIDTLVTDADQCDGAALRERMRHIVPEYLHASPGVETSAVSQPITASKSA